MIELPQPGLTEQRAEEADDDHDSWYSSEPADCTGVRVHWIALVYEFIGLHWCTSSLDSTSVRVH